MRIRQILLIHPARSIRGLIKKYVFAELCDIAFRETESGQEAFSELCLHSFDVVIVSAGLKDMTPAELSTRMAETDHNADTPCIVLSEDENGMDIGEFMRQGLEHVVMMRVRPADLIRKINQVCNPRDWRKDKRFYIPQAEVAVYLRDHDSQEQRVEGTMINISRGGVLVELVTFTPQLLMKSDLQLSLHIPEQPDLDLVYDLPCKLLHLNITEWHPDNSPAAMRVTFVFLEMAVEKANALEQLLQLAIEGDIQKEELN
jgi:DNA-binding NarL/FixJ family response regulator